MWYLVMKNKEKFDYLVNKYNLKKVLLRTKNEYIATISNETLTVLGWVAALENNIIMIAESVYLDPADEILFCSWKMYTKEPLSEIENHLEKIVKQYNMCIKKYKESLVAKKMDDILQDFQ